MRKRAVGVVYFGSEATESTPDGGAVVPCAVMGLLPTAIDDKKRKDHQPLVSY